MASDRHDSPLIATLIATLQAKREAAERVAQLQNEIDLIKAQKAEIGRRQREEAASHRAHKVAREHEFRQLQRKEERTASQLARLELEYVIDAVIDAVSDAVSDAVRGTP